MAGLFSADFCSEAWILISCAPPYMNPSLDLMFAKAWDWLHDATCGFVLSGSSCNFYPSGLSSDYSFGSLPKYQNTEIMSIRPKGMTLQCVCIHLGFQIHKSTIWRKSQKMRSGNTCTLAGLEIVQMSFLWSCGPQTLFWSVLKILFDIYLFKTFGLRQMFVPTLLPDFKISSSKSLKSTWYCNMASRAWTLIWATSILELVIC
jgi:hypothetical protein